MRHIHAIFQFAAEEMEILNTNPFRKLRGKQAPSKKWRHISIDDFWKLYDAASSSWKIMLALCRLAALRRSDAITLTWSNVNFEERVLTFTTQKNKKEARIPMCEELFNILKNAPREMLRLDDRVVPQRNPKERRKQNTEYVSVHNVGRQFQKLCDEAGIPFYSDPLHTLRKSCINDWTRQHPPNVVQEWATHSDIHTTMKHYTKVGIHDEKAAQGSIGGRIDTVSDTSTHANNAC